MDDGVCSSLALLPPSAPDVRDVEDAKTVDMFLQRHAIEYILEVASQSDVFFRDANSSQRRTLRGRSPRRAT
eukprot:1829351-Pyramimonas_sp.AAC.1